MGWIDPTRGGSPNGASPFPLDPENWPADWKVPPLPWVTIPGGVSDNPPAPQSNASLPQTTSWAIPPSLGPLPLLSPAAVSLSMADAVPSGLPPGVSADAVSSTPAGGANPTVPGVGIARAGDPPASPAAGHPDPARITDEIPLDRMQVFAHAIAQAHLPPEQDAGQLVTLPGGSLVPYDGTEKSQSPSGYLMSPVADLGPVAAAGRRTGEIYRQMLAAPNSGGAYPYLIESLGINLGHGGIFDYQREGNSITGFTHFPQFADVSNFNVGLFGQQAGLTLDEILRAAGKFASWRSSNARPDLPYSLDPQQKVMMTRGFNAGASGVFDKSQ